MAVHGQGGEGGDGGQHGLDGDDVRTSIVLLPKQLVRRKYRLRVGIKRDGLPQPTVSNYFVKSLGGGATDFAETGSGIRKRKSESLCIDADLQTGAVEKVCAKRIKMGSTEGQSDL